MRYRTWCAAVGCGFTLISCGPSPIQPTDVESSELIPATPTQQTSPEPPPLIFGVPSVSVAAAGDIGWCGQDGARQTGKLLDEELPPDGLVLALGDNAYPDGSHSNYMDCYEPFWGKYHHRTRPVPGNHEYQTPNAAGYFQYFGPMPPNTSGPAFAGYYSFDYGAWRLYALNSSIDVGDLSPQATWLKSDLEQNRGKRCMLAYWHHPLISSGQNGDNSRMASLWRILQAFGVEMVLVGHDHLYERFSPLGWDGRVNQSEGIRQFIVGTGGAKLYGLSSVKPGSEVITPVWGVLRLELHWDRYDWRFVPVPGVSFSDFGTGYCQ